MRVIKPSYQILTPISEGGLNELKLIEEIARICYKSEDKILEDGSSAKDIVGKLLAKGHEAMIEHSFLSVKFIVDRGVSHELVRHRLASFAQESTRYCNYSKDKFGNELTFIDPFFFADDSTQRQLWLGACKTSEDVYNTMVQDEGCKPQEARTVLPNSLKTEIVVTTNYREWRNIFKLRTAPAAHPQMREVMIPLLLELQSKLPIIFDDIRCDG